MPSRSRRQVYRVLDVKELSDGPLPTLEPEPAHSVEPEPAHGVEPEPGEGAGVSRARAFAPTLLAAAVAGLAAIVLLQTTASHRRGALGARARGQRQPARPPAGLSPRSAAAAGLPAGEPRPSRSPLRRGRSRRVAPAAVTSTATPSTVMTSTAFAGPGPAAQAPARAEAEFGFEQP